MEFGRVFQLGRIGGNFMFAWGCKSINMNDRQSFIPMLEEHTRLFGEGALNTVAADKGYWSSIDKEAIVQQGKPAELLQKPAKTRQKEIDLDLQEHLHNRRAGIEPLIGHVKRGGQMERSRMRSD